jgi:hypothetical protein
MAEISRSAALPLSCIAGGQHPLDARLHLRALGAIVFVALLRLTVPLFCAK